MHIGLLVNTNREMRGVERNGMKRDKGVEGRWDKKGLKGKDEKGERFKGMG